MKTFKALLKQELILTLRTPENIFLGLGMPIAFFLLFSTIWTNDARMTQEQLTIMVRQYMLQMAAFSSISFALMTLPFAFLEDRTGNRLRTLQHSPVPMWQYYFTKALRVLTLFLLAIIGMFLVGHFVKGVTLSWTDWLATAGLLFVGASCMMPFGLLFSFINSLEKLSIISNIFYMGLSVLGGLWMPVTMFPNVMQQLAKFTPTYHLNNLLTTYIDRNFSISSLLILLAYAMIVTVIALAIGKRREVK